MSDITPKIDLLTRALKLPVFTLHALHGVTHCSREEIKAFRDFLVEGGLIETNGGSTAITGTTPVSLNAQGRYQVATELWRAKKPFTVDEPSSASEEKPGLSKEELTATTENDPRPLYRMACYFGVFTKEDLSEKTIGVSRLALKEFEQFLNVQDHAIILRNGDAPTQYKLKSEGEYKLRELLDRADYDSQFEPRAA
jgi:hypothetical protein